MLRIIPVSSGNSTINANLPILDPFALIITPAKTVGKRVAIAWP
jgi:hypothetical protein